MGIEFKYGGRTMSGDAVFAKMQQDMAQAAAESAAKQLQEQLRAFECPAHGRMSGASVVPPRVRDLRQLNGVKMSISGFCCEEARDAALEKHRR